MEHFALALLEWFDRCGRHDLPWQKERSAYRVWVSEIMLQQTRVETVIPYFLRFLERFPTLDDLAEAPIDAVLHHWSGLGYYARARNLHRAAQTIQREYGGKIPEDRILLEQLPGIGRSTAAAILAQAHGQREAILDGNCKRVLARYHRVPGWTGNASVQRELWKIAEALLPDQRLADYTQALMDLGATLCTRSHPRCPDCPVAAGCAARQHNEVALYPQPRPSRQLPLQTRWAAVIVHADGILLLRRPPEGIWGGLFSLPEQPDRDALIRFLHSHFGSARLETAWTECIHHVFSHYRLELRLLRFYLDDSLDGSPNEYSRLDHSETMNSMVMDAEGMIWYNPQRSPPVGLPAPIARFLTDFWSTAHDPNRSMHLPRT